jgi:hypothetical protein
MDLPAFKVKSLSQSAFIYRTDTLVILCSQVSVFCCEFYMCKSFAAAVLVCYGMDMGWEPPTAVQPHTVLLQRVPVS